MPICKCLILAAKHPKYCRKMRVYAIHMGGCECQLTHWEEWDVVSSWWSLFGGGGSETGSGSESESDASDVGGPIYCCFWQMLSTTFWIKS